MATAEVVQDLTAAFTIPKRAAAPLLPTANSWVYAQDNTTSCSLKHLEHIRVDVADCEKRGVISISAVVLARPFFVAGQIRPKLVGHPIPTRDEQAIERNQQDYHQKY